MIRFIIRGFRKISTKNQQQKTSCETKIIVLSSLNLHLQTALNLTKTNNYEKRKIKLSLTPGFVYIVIWMNKSVNDGNYEINLARLCDTMSVPE